MPTLATVLADFIKEYGSGIAGKCTSNGTTTTLIDTSNFKAPVPGGLYPNGCPVRMTSGANAGANTYKSGLDPTTGTITLADTLGAGASASGDTFVISTLVNHIDRLKEACNRALTRRTWRWMKVPLSFVPGGDILGATPAADGYTVVNATSAYQSLAHPEAFYEVAHIVSPSSPNGYAQTAVFDATAGDTWQFFTFYRAIGTGAASLDFRDITNNASITPTMQYGTATTPSAAFLVATGTILIPAGCEQIAVREVGATSGQTYAFGPMVMAPQGTDSYTTEPHLRVWDDISTYYSLKIDGTTPATVSVWDLEYQPASDDGITYDNLGWGIGINWQQAPDFPVFYDELSLFPALVNDADVTNCDEELLIHAMGVELFSMLIRQSGEKPTYYRGKVLPTALMLKKEDAIANLSSPRVSRLLAQRRVVVKRNYGNRVTA